MCCISYYRLSTLSGRQYHILHFESKFDTHCCASQYFSTARPAKVDALKETYGDNVDVVPIADLVTGDYTEALKGQYRRSL